MSANNSDFVKRVSERVKVELEKAQETRELDRISKIDGDDFCARVERRVAQAVLENQIDRRANEERADLQRQLEEIQRQKEELLARFGK